MLSIKPKNQNDNNNKEPIIKISYYCFQPFWFPLSKYYNVDIVEEANNNMLTLANNINFIKLYNSRSIDPFMRALQDLHRYEYLIQKFLTLKSLTLKYNIKVPQEIWVIILEYLLKINMRLFKKILINNYYLFPYLQYI